MDSDETPKERSSVRVVSEEENNSSEFKQENLKGPRIWTDLRFPYGFPNIPCNHKKNKNRGSK